ncbi:gp123 [Bacillus phage G]|uniref:Gp123 n=1 Tax=Bacillus phage G TaxID=2884420 RepID=G3MBI5_9CAUD|nr:gp123 [Bacillus phage G]AEO93385.1 gp123 [Bacillus phage G]
MKRLKRQSKVFRQSRLKKKSWDAVSLKHYTSTQHFIEIMNEGQITPGGYNGNISGGGHVKYLSMSDGSNTTKKMSPSEIDRLFSSDLWEIDKDLLNYVNETKDTDEWYSKQINVNIIQPSHDQNGVYLTNRSDENDYGKEAVNNGLSDDYPNFEITLEFNVQTDALGPDLDDGKIDKESETPLWRQTIDSIGQCVHYGPISIDSISQVIIKDYGQINGYEMRFSDRDNFLSWASEFISFEQGLSAADAYSQIQKMYEEFDNYYEEEDFDDENININDDDDFDDDDIDFDIDDFEFPEDELNDDDLK